MKLISIISNGALLLQNAPIGVRGYEAAPEAAVTASLVKGGAVIASAEATVDAEGKFTITLPGQAGSFDPYEIKVSSGDETVTVEDILFGEVWLASGQSNMEMHNLFMSAKNKMRKMCAERKLRFYHQRWMLEDGKTDGEFPFEPVYDQPGKWITGEDEGDFDWISACASAATVEMYNTLNKNGAVMPVGFINCSVGSTAIEVWLPKESLFENPDIYRHQTEYHKENCLPKPETWNTKGANNFVQHTALYNLKVAPLGGIKVRGVLWYQGESNTWDRKTADNYYNCMLEYSRVYTKLFSPDGNTIPMVLSHLYPWLYEQLGTECVMGYLNSAIDRAVKDHPDKFGAVSIYDLPPVWAYAKGNHPIHPANKYPVGTRLGRAACAMAYGTKGPSHPVYYSSAISRDGKLYVTFDVPEGDSLECSDDIIKGFYIAGEDGHYLEACAEIVSRDTVVLSHRYIKTPINAAYQYAQLQRDGNLFASGLPVAPFATDTVNPVRIAPTPWCDTKVEHFWIQDEITTTRFNCYNRALWLPMPGSELCRDDVFSVSGLSIRVVNLDDGIPGAYVKAHKMMPLELAKYKAMTLAVFGKPDAVKLTLHQTKAENIEVRTTLNAEKFCEYGIEFDGYRFDLTSLDDSQITRMELTFETSKPLHGANFDCIDLIPKGYEE